MKNSILRNILMLVAATIMVAACSKSPNIGAYIPDDAIVVTNVNIASLWQKADIDNIDDISFVKLARQELRNEDKQISDIVDAIIQDPKSTGLDLKSDIAFFVNDEYAAVIAPMHKKSKFEAFLKDLAAKTNEELSIKDDNGCTKASFDFLSVVFDKNTAIFCSSLNADKTAELLNLDKDESLADDKNFREYWKNHGDISAWFSFETIFDLAEMMSGTDLDDYGYSQEYIDAIEEGSCSMNINFDKGAILCNVEIQGVDKKLYDDYSQKFNTSLVDYMPQESFAALSYAIRTDMLADMLGNTHGYDFDEPVIAGKTVIDIVNAFGGSLVASIFDIVSNDETTIMPLFAVAADIKDAKTAKTIVNELGLERNGDIYVLPDLGIDTRFFLAMTDKAVYLCNSIDAAKQFLNGGYKNGMKDIASKAKKGNYIFVDLNISHYPKALTSIIPSSAANLMAQYLDYAECAANSPNKSTFTIALIDKKQNSLLSTLHFVDDNLLALGNLADELDFDSYDDSEMWTMDTVAIEEDWY